MYNFLLSIRKLSIAMKIIILIALFLLGSLYLAIVFLVFLAKSRETNPDRYKSEIQEFQLNYDKLRGYVTGSKENMIYVGSYLCEYNGEICYLSKFISIYVKNVSDSITKAYPDIEQRQIENDVYFQFPIKKKYSKTAKITIIREVLKYINEKYRDDLIQFDSSVPIGISGVGLKKITDMLSDKK